MGGVKEERWQGRVRQVRGLGERSEWWDREEGCDSSVWEGRGRESREKECRIG